jgi:hypothetical protein
MKTYKLKHLNTPNSWDDVGHFCDWYLENNMPINFSNNPEVFLSDDATAVCLFKHGQFQVELYLIHPEPKVPIHEHPNVEVIKVRIEGDEANASNILTNNQSHGAGFRLEGEKIGFPLLAVQHWKTEHPPTTIASQWKGRTVGPMQESLIKRFHPNALVFGGYADVTRTMDYLEELKYAKSA